MIYLNKKAYEKKEDREELQLKLKKKKEENNDEGWKKLQISWETQGEVERQRVASQAQLTNIRTQEW